MTPEQLKTSILQYAIQGKLVEQRAEEGTGSDLYNQIQAERKKLIKDGIIKKEKALPECDDIELPTSWKVCKLGDCIDLLSGQDLTSDRYNDKEEGIVYLTGASNIDDSGSIIINRWTTSSTSVAHKGDLLLTCKGTIGKTCILDIDEAHIARQIMAITEILVDINYLRYFIEISIKKLQRKAKSMIPGIDRDTVRGLDFPLPPLEEQHRIVAKIEELMPFVDRYAASYEKLEQFNAKFPEDMKKSILQYAIQGKLVEQRVEEGNAEDLYQQIQEEKQKLIKEGKIKKEKPLAEITEDEILFDIPESWKWVHLKDIMSVYGGKRIPAGKKLTKENTGHIYIRVSDMKNGSVSDADIHYVPEDVYPQIKNYTISKDDVYITVAGTIGRVGIIPEEFDNANLTENADKLVIYQLNKRYIMYLMDSSIIQKQITDATTKVGQPKLAIKRIEDMLIPLPPLAEQERIADKVDQLLPYCDQLIK